MSVTYFCFTESKRYIYFLFFSFLGKQKSYSMTTSDICCILHLNIFDVTVTAEINRFYTLWSSFFESPYKTDLQQLKLFNTKQLKILVFVSLSTKCESLALFSSSHLVFFLIVPSCYLSLKLPSGFTQILSFFTRLYLFDETVCLTKNIFRFYFSTSQTLWYSIDTHIYNEVFCSQQTILK